MRGGQSGGRGLQRDPSDFDYVINLAVAKSGRWEKDLAANAESVGLLMAHCADAKAFLHCSSAAVYDPPDDEPRTEATALGDNHKAMFPTYSISKIAGEVVARTMARALGVPTVSPGSTCHTGTTGDGRSTTWRCCWPASRSRSRRVDRPATTRFTRTTSSRRCRSSRRGVGPGDDGQLVWRADCQPSGMVRLPRLAGWARTGLRRECAGAARRSHRRDSDAGVGRRHNGRLAGRNAPDGRQVSPRPCRCVNRF